MHGYATVVNQKLPWGPTHTRTSTTAAPLTAMPNPIAVATHTALIQTAVTTHLYLVLTTSYLVLA